MRRLARRVARRVVRSRFVRNAATLQVGATLNTVGNFLSSILLAHVLGAERQGLFYSALALYGLFYLLASLGFVQGAVSQVAACAARGDRDRVAQWLAFMAKSWLLLGAGLAGLCFLALPPLAEAVYGDRRLGIWASWLAFIPLLEMPRTVVRVAFEGTRRMLSLAQMENGAEVLRVFLVVAGALITGTAEGAVLGTIAASAMGGVLALEMYRGARRDGGAAGAPGPLPGLRDVWSQVGSVPMRKGARLGVRLGLLRVMDAVMLEVVPTLVLLKFADPTWVAYFRIAQRLMRIPLTIMQGISRTALPALSELAGIRDMRRFKSTFLKVTLGGGSIIAAGVLLWLPLIPLLVERFYPPDYASPVWKLCAILAVGAVTVSYASATDAFYIATNQMRVPIRLGAISTVIVAVLMVVLASAWPRTGTAWAVVIGMCACVTHYVYIAWWFRRHPGGRLPGPERASPAAATEA